jgi:hypothetical protein
MKIGLRNTVLSSITVLIPRYSHIPLIEITDQAKMTKNKSSLNTNVQFIILKIISVMQFPQAK